MTLRPRTDEILTSILLSFEEFIVPELRDEFAVSVGHTIMNLLRHTVLRVQLEGPALHEGIKDLEATLADIASFAAQCDGAQADVMRSLVRDVEDTLASAADDPQRYRSVLELTAVATLLGECLDRCLLVLQRADDDVRGTPGYDTVRSGIRTCLARQLEREATWIEPAFSGLRR